MRQGSSDDKEKRDQRIEIRVHIEMQEEITQRLSHELDLNVGSPEFLRGVHERFYSRYPAGGHLGQIVLSFRGMPLS